VGKAARKIREKARALADWGEGASLALEAWVGPKADFVGGAIVICATLLAMYWSAGGTAGIKRDLSETAVAWSLASWQPPGERGAWLAQEWVLAPASEIDESLGLPQSILLASASPQYRRELRTEAGLPPEEGGDDADDAKTSNGQKAKPKAEWPPLLTRGLRRDLLIEQGRLPWARGDEMKPAAVVETRAAWEAGRARRAAAREWAKLHENAAGWPGEAARERLKEPAEPTSLGLGGELALADGGDGSPGAAFARARAIARANGSLATLPADRQALAMSAADAASLAQSAVEPVSVRSVPAIDALVQAVNEQYAEPGLGADALKRGFSGGGIGFLRGNRLVLIANNFDMSPWEFFHDEAADERDKSAGVFAKLLDGGLSRALGGILRLFGSAIAAFVLASALAHSAGSAFSWALGGLRLARWGAWAALRSWSARALAFGLAGAIFALAGAGVGRAAVDVAACSRGGCEAFGNAMGARGDAGAVSAGAKQGGQASQSVGWAWALGADPLLGGASRGEGGATRGDARQGLSDAAAKRAAGAEQERLARPDRGFWSLVGAAGALAFGLAAFAERERRREAKAAASAAAQKARSGACQGLGAPKAPPAIGDPAWQKEQIRLAKARAEAKEIAAAARLGEAKRAQNSVAEAGAGNAAGESPAKRSPRRI
jgi:hypothetical protein